MEVGAAAGPRVGVRAATRQIPSYEGSWLLQPPGKYPISARSAARGPRVRKVTPAQFYYIIPTAVAAPSPAPFNQQSRPAGDDSSRVSPGKSAEPRSHALCQISPARTPNHADSAGA